MHGSLKYAYSLYEERHCLSGGICQQIHEQSQVGAMESSYMILRYLKESSDMALCYEGTDFHLHGYVDSDFGVM